MRIYFTNTSRPDAQDIARLALSQCREAGTIAKHVGFKAIAVCGIGAAARKAGFKYALEIQLDAQERDRGRRAGNTGSYGASTGYGGDGMFAATYDEWGFFLAAMYRMDQAMRVEPNFKRGYALYYGEGDFHDKTGRTYDAAYPDYVEEFGDDYPKRGGRSCIGRRGFGRIDVDSPNSRYGKLDTRSAEWLRKFHAGEVF